MTNNFRSLDVTINEKPKKFASIQQVVSRKSKTSLVDVKVSLELSDLKPLLTNGWSNNRGFEVRKGNLNERQKHLNEIDTQVVFFFRLLVLKYCVEIKEKVSFK